MTFPISWVYCACPAHFEGGGGFRKVMRSNGLRAKMSDSGILPLMITALAFPSLNVHHHERRPPNGRAGVEAV